jgi:spore germination protein YaaH
MRDIGEPGVWRTHFALQAVLTLLPIIASACVFGASHSDSPVERALSSQLAAPALSDPAPTVEVAPSVKQQVWGYVPDYDWPAAWVSAEAHGVDLAGVSLFQYHLDSQGNLIRQPKFGEVPAWAIARGLTIVPMITNQVGNAWDRDIVARVLSDSERRRHHVAQIVALAVRGGYSAVELDYENLSAPDRETFSAFVEELGAALRMQRKELSVAVHAKLAEPGAWGGAPAQDWSRIGAAADRVVVMTYDYGPDRPGPIAPLKWTRDVLRFATALIPAGKVIQGIPLYGYDWAKKQPAADHTYRELIELAQRHEVLTHRDAADRHLTFEYTVGAVRHEVWLADGVTVQALMTVGREMGVAGYALWRLGGEDPTVWSTVGEFSGR